MDATKQLKEFHDYIKDRIKSLVNERNSIIYASENYGTKMRDDRIIEINTQIITFNEMYYVSSPNKNNRKI